MLKSRIVWCLFILAAVAFLLFSDSSVALLVLVLTIFLPLLLIGLNQMSARKISASISASQLAAKEEEITCSLNLFNARRLPLAPVHCRLYCENTLTGEVLEPELLFSLPEKKERNVNFNLSSRYCGCLRVQLASLKIYDVFGLTAVNVPCTTSGETVVMPDTFSINLALMTHLAQDLEAVEYSQHKAGFDPSETFAIREYLPGDSLQRIHWKLSSKFDEILIKEASLPVHQSFLVLLETGLQPEVEAEADVLDALLEITQSVCQQMSEEQIAYEIAWMDREEEGFFHEHISSVDDLSAVADKLLRVNFACDSLDSLQALRESKAFNDFEHLIYISTKLQGDLSTCSPDTLLTAIVCQHEGGGESEQTGNARIYYCSPDNYEKELFVLTI